MLTGVVDTGDHKAAFDAEYMRSGLVQAILDGRRKVRNPAEDLSEDVMSSADKWFYRLFCRVIYDLLELKDRVRLLDVGCGLGFDETNVKQLVPDAGLYGVDISETMVRAAVKNETPASLALASAEAIPFRASSFDRVLSREVVEHVMDPRESLREIYRVLRDDGIAVITTPNGDAIELFPFLERVGAVMRISVVPRKECKDEPMRLDELERLFAECGFRIKQRILDGGCYGEIMNLPWRLKVIKLPLARTLRFVQYLPLMDRLFCTQVKYSLIKLAKVEKRDSKSVSWQRSGTDEAGRPSEDRRSSLLWRWSRRMCGVRASGLTGRRARRLRQSAESKSSVGASPTGVWQWRVLYGVQTLWFFLIYLPLMVTLLPVAAVCAFMRRSMKIRKKGVAGPHII